MDSITIFQIIVAGLLWLATIILLLGRGELLGFDFSFTPNKETEPPEEKKRQCRYIALRLTLPLAIIFTVLTVGEIMQSPWFEQFADNPWLGVLFLLAVFAYIFFIVSRLNSGKYKK